MKRSLTSDVLEFNIKHVLIFFNLVVVVTHNIFTQLNIPTQVLPS